MLREIVVWREIDHANVLKFLGVCRGVGGRIALVSEWMENGNVGEFLENNPYANRGILVRNPVPHFA